MTIAKQWSWCKCLGGKGTGYKHEDLSSDPQNPLGVVVNVCNSSRAETGESLKVYGPAGLAHTAANDKRQSRR